MYAKQSDRLVCTWGPMSHRADPAKPDFDADFDLFSSLLVVRALVRSYLHMCVSNEKQGVCKGHCRVMFLRG